ncbi:MAG: glycerol kinase GlpK [Spirochaetales bacterium]|uniref:Glycerol kinase n=1 Tax=Candidatus Thalassospirochaeta sargassi TaxID=3119039 RepID=A0AAJ1MHM4_9SPIO|nr:glycerol kinase GlpK [Spirochaetales bacterium]
MQHKFIGSIDQGTTSTRFILFDVSGTEVFSHQIEHRQIFPQPGWVEHDPLELWENTRKCVMTVLADNNVRPQEIAAVGITNQRETTMVWDKTTGLPLHNAIVWQDTRTAEMVSRLAADGGSDRFRGKTGLPLAPYFAGTKMKWLLDNSKKVAEAVVDGRALFGTIDAWIVWKLTGGRDGGSHVTDVTNASRTLLMDLEKLQWDEEQLKHFGVPAEVLPDIVSSIPDKPYGYTRKDGAFGAEVPVCGILGDQQAAMFGQACFEQGTSKNTYGTGCFMLANTGTEIVQSRYGLLTTPLYKIGDEPAVYSLEGSIAVAGSLVQWIRDNIGLVKKSSDIEKLALKAEDNGGVYFVPAFAGLFAPRWRPDARGVIAGLTGFANASHIARAVLESTAFQTREIFHAMEKDAGITISSLKVDGGMTANNLLMQFQADMLDVPVVRPVTTETTALGAAYAAGLSSGFWGNLEELKKHWGEDKRWNPSMPAELREEKYALWNKAVEKTLNWID